MHLKYTYKIIFIIILMINYSCVEEFPLVTDSFEDILVVEATITDELKTQEVKLSRSIGLDSDTVVFEENARVRIETDNNIIYNFSYTKDGIYESNQQFNAQDGISYQLFIDTNNGRSYSSNIELLPPKSKIENVYAELINDNGELGVQVFIDSNSDLSKPKFFRYEYEETYKIVAPLFFIFDLVFTNVTGSGSDISFDTEEVLRPREEEICYSSDKSNTILITSINGLQEANVSRFPIRFISSDDAIIRERYSILVKQFTQSADANNFYKILKQLGTDESLLIDIQPGFVQGNIFSTQDPNEKVFGFFDVSSVTSKRIFFDHTDFDLDRPRYFFDCEVIEVNSSEPSGNATLFRLLETEGFKYLDFDPPNYLVVRPECGDCTSFSSSLKPEFWED